MTDYHGRRSNRGIFIEDAVKKQVDVVRRILDGSSGPRPFAFGARPFAFGPRPFGAADMQAAAHWLARVRKGQAEYSKKMSAASRARRAAAGSYQQPLQSAWESLKAGARGAIDSLPFDLGDYLVPALRAHVANELGLDPVAVFHQQLARERGQNRYDEAVHPNARTVGKVGGTVAQLAVPGMALPRLAAAPRMAQAAPMIFKEGAKLTGYGGLGGLGMQAVDDGLQGRLSSPGDYIGSGVGGGVGVLTALYSRPGFVGGATGGATSLGQDLFNARIRSVADARAAVDRAADAAATANLLALPIVGSIAHRANKLPPKSKGDLGEWLSRQRSWLRGKTVDERQVPRKVKGGYTRLDHVEVDGDDVEAKFGSSIKRLYGRQHQAYHELPNYRVDHFTPNDLAGAAGVPLGSAFYHLDDNNYRQ
jgi:hypothetical protein